MKLSIKGTSLFGSLAALGLLGGCAAENPWSNESGEKGFGTIAPIVDFDSSVVASRSSRSEVSEIEDITVNDLSLTLTSENGSFSETYPISDFPTDKGFPIGDYTLTASYGDPEEEGFGHPSVDGSCELTVMEGRVAQPSVTAELDKAMVAIVFDPELTDYMTFCSAKLHSAGGIYVDYPSTERRSAYLRPGEITVYLNFEKPNGIKGENVEVASFTAEPKHRYTLTVSLGGDGYGSAGITVTYDDVTEKHDKIINISDETLTTPAPELSYSGFTPGEVLNIIEGTISTDVKPMINVKALGKVAKALLTTSQCHSLIEAGWPAEVDLVSAPASTIGIMKGLGLKTMGLNGNTDVFGSLDFSNVIANIGARSSSQPASSFTLVVTDKTGKSTAPVTLSVKVEKLELTMAYTSSVYTGESTIDLTVDYNGPNLKDNVTFEYKNERGTWSKAEVTNVTQTRASYTVTLKVPSDAITPLVFRAMVGSQVSELTVPIAEAPTATVNDNDVFAKSAWVKLSSPDYNCADKNIEIYGSTNGTTYSKMTGTQSGAEFHLTGLTPGTTYYIRGKVGSLESAPVTFKTESSAQLTNGNMDSGWSSTTKNNGAAKCTVWTAPSPWGTNNSTTTGSLKSGSSYSGVSAVEKTTDAVSGGSAALIRTVGYGQGTLVAGPSTFAVGQMTYDAGFTSRPSAISFQAKHSAYSNGEQGVAQVAVKDAGGNTISSGSVNISSSSYGKVTIPLTYTRGAAQAATISVKFLSTNANASKTTCASHSDKYSYGSALYIDDVELEY